jgi:hypothetical protein
MIYIFLVLWPAGNLAKASGDTWQEVNLFGPYYPPLRLMLDVRILLMVMVAGGLGSFIHAATSFGDYVGNEKLTINWTWWYILRPGIGMILAGIFYLVVRGGFLSAGTQANDINLYGVAALAGLVGLFSKQAIDKLSEVFTTLFRTAPGQGDSKRKDDLNNPVPVVNDIEPKRVEPLTENVVVTVLGTGFVRGAAVNVNGETRETEYVAPTQLTVKLLPGDVENAGELQLAVFNPGPGGGTSVPIKMRIAASDPALPSVGSDGAADLPPQPEPPVNVSGDSAQSPAAAARVATVTHVSPSTGPSKGNTPVTISGSNFASSSSVFFGQNPAQSVTVLSPTAIVALSPSHEAGAVDIVVESPGGGRSVAAGGYAYEADA